ncbi:4-fold beta flower protein [Providencia rettgeri]
MTPVYRCNGKYFGFIINSGYFFDAESQYIGWVDDNALVWRKDGSFLGEIIDENYIMRRLSSTSYANRTRRPTPTTPSRCTRFTNRAKRCNQAGRIDALDEFLE